MELGDIFRDALVYPLNNIVSMILYIILGIIAGIVVGGTLAALVSSVAANNVLATLGSGILAVIVAVFIGCIISGYQLDIIKYGINRDSSGPSIDPIRQFINGLKSFAVSIIYYFIPIIIVSILAIFFRDWIIAIITFVLFVIFALAQMMAQCRLAKTEDLVDALAIGEAIGDISRVGIPKLLIFVVLIGIISFVLILIAVLITRWNSFVGGIILGILGVYIMFFVGRSTGLLYSEV